MANPRLHQILRRLTPKSKLRRAHETLAIVYISLNEAKLIKTMVGNIDTSSNSVSVFMDSRSAESELKILEEAGIPFTLIENSHDFVEGLYGPVCHLVGTDWVWILNSDEWPSPESIRAVKDGIARASNLAQCLAFPRRWVRYSSARGLEYSRARFIGRDYQWRVIRVNHVEFQPRIHTPGFKFDRSRAQKIQSFAKVYHFDWIAHSFATRTKKIAFYELHHPGSASYFSPWYLPELFGSQHRFKKEMDPQATSIAIQILSDGRSGGWTDALGSH